MVTLMPANLGVKGRVPLKGTRNKGKYRKFPYKASHVTFIRWFSLHNFLNWSLWFSRWFTCWLNSCLPAVWWNWSESSTSKSWSVASEASRRFDRRWRASVQGTSKLMILIDWPSTFFFFTSRSLTILINSPRFSMACRNNLAATRLRSLLVVQRRVRFIRLEPVPLRLGFPFQLCLATQQELPDGCQLRSRSCRTVCSRNTSPYDCACFSWFSADFGWCWTRPSNARASGLDYWQRLCIGLLYRDRWTALSDPISLFVLVPTTFKLGLRRTSSPTFTGAFSHL